MMLAKTIALKYCYCRWWTKRRWLVQYSGEMKKKILPKDYPGGFQKNGNSYFDATDRMLNTFSERSSKELLTTLKTLM